MAQPASPHPIEEEEPFTKILEIEEHLNDRKKKPKKTTSLKLLMDGYGGKKLMQQALISQSKIRSKKAKEGSRANMKSRKNKNLRANVGSSSQTETIGIMAHVHEEGEMNEDFLLMNSLKSRLQGRLLERGPLERTRDFMMESFISFVN